jgi:FkbM family methyltransferase
MDRFLGPIGTAIDDASNTESSQLDPDAVDCTQILDKFRADEIEVTKTNGENLFQRSFATVTKTEKPFYVATHDTKIDGVRSAIMKYQWYYERQLTARVAEIFDEKSAHGEESIMLDVGANIGWFSLVAAAHGATKVYSFEPNLQNTVRFCESLSLNRWLHDDRSRDVVIPIQKGVGSENGMKKLYAHKASHRNPGAYSFSDEYKGERVLDEIDITTLDSFAERHGWFVGDKPTIALFKVDVEGLELQVLEGAKQLLGSKLIEKIAMEIQKKQTNEIKTEVIKTLHQAGYELYLHGEWMGPWQKVKKSYQGWEDLASDFHNNTYNENVMFRLRQEA